MTQEEYTQWIRLIDIFIIGPSIIYAGAKMESVTWFKILLILIGVSTILYNGVNYIRVAKS